MNFKTAITLSGILFSIPVMNHAQSVYSQNLEWKVAEKISFPEEILKINFEGAAHYNELKGIPFFVSMLEMGARASEAQILLLNDKYVPTSDEENEWLKKNIPQHSSPVLSAEVSTVRKIQNVFVKILPFRFNTSNGRFEKLLSFSYRIQVAGPNAKIAGPGDFASSSVLSSGNWFKVGVLKDGIHKLTFHALKQMGLDSIVNPNSIKLYGNGGGMVPQSNSAFRHDDLVENAILVSDENNNGKFDNADFILFYGESPHRWEYNPVDQRFHHISNRYSDTTYYFITAGNGLGKRVLSMPSVSSPNQTVTSFDGYAFHEIDRVNLIRSGSEWYGEAFEIQTSYNFPFSFPGLITSVPVYLKCDAIGRSTSGCKFDVSANGQLVMSLTSPPVSTNYTQPFAYMASENSLNDDTFFSNGSDINVGISFNKPNSSAGGWLNYLELNARQSLAMTGSQLNFRDMLSVAPGNVAQFFIGVNTNSIQVWDVTDPTNSSAMNLNVSSNQISFTAQASDLREYIAFSNAGFLAPVSFGKVENQNLHGLSQIQMIMVVHPKFLAEGKRLAEFHRENNSLSVEVVTPQEIFNEFSSGAQDISAIRDFMRMFYERSTSESDLPKYLLLFGDGSYDPKYRVSGNTNYICTCESLNSLSPTGSYLTDDFFVQLDPNEGNCNTGGSDLPDVAIGRLPVKTSEEAKRIVDKIIRYASNPSEAFRDWRNVVTLVADDGDGNTHLNQADRHAKSLQEKFGDYNIDKIYFDAYKMESTPGGQRYPDVNAAIDQRIAKGGLIMNYTGHGGESGWAHERVLDFSMINSWKNIEKLPLFFTATCEFSRFDDPAFTSAGELVLLSGNGGAIGLMTTTRLVFSSNNDVLNSNFFDLVFKLDGEKPPSLGEIFRRTKVASGPLSDNRNFTFLGDPAIQLYHPKYDVITTHIQGNAVGNNHPGVKPGLANTSSSSRVSTVFEKMDTIQALSRVTIRGELRDKEGNKLNSFSGIVYPTVYDKSDSVQTLANKSDNFKTRFSLRRNIIYKGKASVKNGEFTFTFVVPKDISYEYGFGRISYYAENGVEDAAGHFEDFIIGGIDPNAPKDDTGPTVKLYMNDEKFAFGGLTDENPKLYAVVSDLNGINTVGTGIGHDITAILDNESSNVIVLNDYYESDLDSYQTGKVSYPFKDLKAGVHSLKIRVWDVYDNSTEAETQFIVAPSAEFALQHVLNYPNPFTTKTSFYFEHNRPNMPMNAQVQVFTITGKLVKTIEAPVYNVGYHAGPIEWNGRDDYGDKIGKGVYVYRLRVRTGDGKYADKTEKLVILN